jgi:hypothetical protein
MTAEHQAGVEKAAALVTSVFLTGTQNRAEPASRQGTAPRLDGLPERRMTAGLVP